MLYHQIEAEGVLDTFMLHIKHIASRPLRADEVVPLNLPPSPRNNSGTLFESLIKSKLHGRYGLVAVIATLTNVAHF